MKRRDFINSGLLASTAAIVSPGLLSFTNKTNSSIYGKARNIIFMVSDGMSSGTLNMADLLSRRKEGRGSTWIDLYRNNRISRALMDTASANSLVTDSAAASSSWGGGRRVKNGSLNVNTDGSVNRPILQKFKDVGKSVGCVTTVPITHATPAGFSVTRKHRNMQDLIASDYLDLRFDVMMGGGLEYFNGKKRKDGLDIFNSFDSAGFQVIRNKTEMAECKAGEPLIGVFCEDGLPYAIDFESNNEQKALIPTLAEMTKKAIKLMEANPDGFVLQVEGGKIDWAAHANDTPALLYEQLAFDQAVAEAICFAEKRDDTLVIITTDHGNANPGLIKSKKVDVKFDTLQNVVHSNEWVLFGIGKNDKASLLIERLNYAQGINITKDEANSILKAYNEFDDPGLYNSYELPFEVLARIQANYNSVHWSGMNHSADFVELSMFGPGSDDLSSFIKNYDLHIFMLNAAGII